MSEFVAQCGEDQWLAANWQDLGLPAVGYFVDVGAADGKEFSNTYWLEHEMGWSGLLIEPDLRHQIRDRPRCTIERVAVGPIGELALDLTADPFLNRSLPTTPNNEPRLLVEKQIVVPSRPLNWLLIENDVEQVDLLSIDTEGTEIEAWRTLDLARWRPRIVIVEYSTWHLRDDFEGIKDVWEADGYELLHTTQYNCIFKDKG